MELTLAGVNGTVRELRSWGVVIGWAPEHQGSGSLRKCLESGYILSQTIQEMPLLWSALDLLSCALCSRGCPVGCGPRQGWHGGTLALRGTASVSSRSAGSYLPGLKGSMIGGLWFPRSYLLSEHALIDQWQWQMAGQI